MDFSCQKLQIWIENSNIFSWFFILNHKLKLKSLIFVSKLQIQINLLDFSFQRRKFKYIFMINFLDFSCQNCKFKSIYRIFLVKDTNSNIFSWFFMVYYKFGYFLLFLLSKFEFEWMWQIFLVKNTSFLLLTCSFFTTFSIFEF